MGLFNHKVIFAIGAIVAALGMVSYYVPDFVLNTMSIEQLRAAFAVLGGAIALFWSEIVRMDCEIDELKKKVNGSEGEE